MSFVKEIVIFANSVKHHEHCIAGKDTATKNWVRPVSDDLGSALSNQQVKCRNIYGTFPVKLLQKVKVKLLRHSPLVNQPENYVVSSEIWDQCYNLNENALNEYLDYPQIIWNTNCNSSNGLNDRVTFEKIQEGIISITQSLYLIQPSDLKYIITTNVEGSKRIRISFNFCDINYNLPTTDPNIWRRLQNTEIGTENIENGQKTLCISLGEKYIDGFCYKIVASIF